MRSESGFYELRPNAVVILCNIGGLRNILRQFEYLHYHSLVITSLGESSLVDWSCYRGIVFDLLNPNGESSSS